MDNINSYLHYLQLNIMMLAKPVFGSIYIYIYIYNIYFFKLKIGPHFQTAHVLAVKSVGDLSELLESLEVKLQFQHYTKCTMYVCIISVCVRTCLFYTSVCVFYVCVCVLCVCVCVLCVCVRTE